MEAVKYFLWLNPDRCSMLFANHVLIVEGPTEKAFINKLIGEGSIKRPADGLYVLDSIGKFNIHRFMNLLSHLGIPHSVLHDDDNGENEQAEVNQLLQDSRHAELTTVVQTVPGDLESFLGVAKSKSDHRKHNTFCFFMKAGRSRQKGSWHSAILFRVACQAHWHR